MRTACWLAWTTLTLVAYLSEAVPFTDPRDPCQLGDDPTLGDLVLFRLCLEEEQNELQLNDVTARRAVPEIPNTKRDEAADWPVDETGSDAGDDDDGEFPYCYPLTPTQCRMLVITLDDILRLSEADPDDGNDTGDELDGGRVKRSTNREIVRKFWRHQARQPDRVQKRLSLRERKILLDYIEKHQPVQKPGHSGMIGRFGRSVPDDANQIIEDSDSGHVIQKRDTRTDDVVRSKRAVLSRMPPRAKQLLAAFRVWRAKNGYGAGKKGTTRWG